jgi:hypothetical protein
VANRQYIERLEQVITHLHSAVPTWRESVPVHEVFRGQTVWKGNVEVFDLAGHPKAKRCYAWSYPERGVDQDEKFVAVLELPPVVSPETAVRAAIVSESKAKPT